MLATLREVVVRWAEVGGCGQSGGRQQGGVQAEGGGVAVRREG